MADVTFEKRLVNGERLVVIDHDVPPRPGRQLLLAVDTSDSCWSRARDATRGLMASIADRLERGDACTVWQLGQSEPLRTVRFERAEDRAGLSHALAEALTENRRGTWLTATLDAMLRAAHASDGAATLLVLTDGEIFDLEPATARWLAAGPTAPQAAVVWIGAAPPHELLPGCAMIRMDDPGRGPLDRLLTIEAPAPRLEPRWSGGRAMWRWSLAGQDVRLTPLDPSQPSVTADDGRFRLAFLGGHAEPRVVVGPSGRVVESRSAARTTSDDVERVARRLEGRLLLWRSDVLAALATPGPAELRCPNCDAAFLPDPRRRLWCRICGALIVVHGNARARDVDAAIATRVFSLAGADLCADAAAVARAAQFLAGRSFAIQDGDPMAPAVLAVSLER